MLRWRSFSLVSAAFLALLAAPAARAGVPSAQALLAVALGAGVVGAVAVTPLVTAGRSMWPTLALRTVGVVVAPWLWPPQPGAVVVAADGGRLVGKRLLAVGGETVRSAGGAVWVDGAPAAARGCRLPVDLSLLDPAEEHVFTVPAGEVWLVGDHVSSTDGRTRGTVPASALVGRYLPLVGWGAPPVVVPRGPDAADLAEALAAEHPHRAQLAGLVAAGGYAPAHLGLLLWWSFVALGRPERGWAALERRLLAERDPTDRGTWVHLLSRAYAEAGSWADVARVTDAAVPPAHPFAAVIAARRAFACARLHRWADALAAAERVPEGAVRGAELGPRLAALVALGRLDEAEQLADAITARRGWADAWHPAWYAAQLAVARGDLARGAGLVREALAAGLTDVDAVRTHPLLAPLRDSPAWAAVEAALPR